MVDVKTCETFQLLVVIAREEFNGGEGFGKMQDKVMMLLIESEVCQCSGRMLDINMITGSGYGLRRRVSQ